LDGNRGAEERCVRASQLHGLHYSEDEWKTLDN
jgi:hypothetical protein